MKSFTDFISLFSRNSKGDKVRIPISINQKIHFLIITVLLLFTVTGKAAEGPSNFEFAINKINYHTNFTPSSPHGFITVSFTPGQDAKYLSVFAENNSENISGFIVENMFLPSIDVADSITEFSTTFFLSQVSVSLKLPITLTLTAYITDFPDYFPFQNDSIAKIAIVDVKEMIYNIGDIIIPQIEIPDAPLNEVQQPAEDSLKHHVHRKDVDNIDLDSAAHPPTATYAGDDGACAPAATANSFKWLEKTYPNVKLPADMTLRKALEKLSGLMKRKPNDGPFPDDMVKGKLDFISEFKLPVEVKFQIYLITEDITGTSGNKAKNLRKPGEKPSWDFLKQMMQEGEDVEINVTQKDSLGFTGEGHTVVVTGIQEYASGFKSITFKHDLDQSCPGGEVEETNKATIDTSGWLRYGINYDHYILGIVAESPVKSDFGEPTPVELASSVTLRNDLAQNYPNPFNPNTNFGFRIADLGLVTLKIYDILGNEIATVLNEEKEPGEYNITFNASELSSGVYYYQLKAGSYVSTKKMIVLK